MALRFGTDGVRGEALTELSTEFVGVLGLAAGEVLETDRWVLGRDTRESGPELTRALAAGAAASGVTIVDLGVVPTPTVAHLSAVENCGGAMISASHNPWMDNGVKLFAPGGQKLRDEQQESVQARLDELIERPDPIPSAPSPVAHPDPAGSYCSSIAAALEGRDLSGLRLVLDCANGAASPIAGGLAESLGAEVHLLHDQPDGRNINDGCGSTHPGSLQAAVVELDAHMGLAFDGDADRLIAVDDTGALVDGDRLMAMFAVDLRDRGRLAHDTLVVTVMSNLGLRQAMARAGVQIEETPVGDRNVLEALDAGGFDLGGEQSGHLIFRRLATTGDGLLSGMLFADLLKRSGRAASNLAAEAMTALPQVLLNVPVSARPVDLGTLDEALSAVETELGSDGRVLLRASGTEPVIRVMVEATTQELARTTATRLATVVAEHYG